jgi:formamidopyrimidine-DNA glycosylase
MAERTRTRAPAHPIGAQARVLPAHSGRCPPPVPELPEVETIRRQLAPALTGATIADIEVLDPRWCEPLPPEHLRAALVGRGIEALDRRGKYLHWRLEGDLHLLMHLRMTGTLLLDPLTVPPHTRVLITLGHRGCLAFVDPRRFGTGQLLHGDAELDAFYAARLGVEPFDEAFTAVLLRRLARGRGAPIKAFLLDQRMIAGIGNIYADEALFRSGVHPRRAAGALRPAQYALLREAIRAVLAAGIDARGASIDDFRHLDGARGSFQDLFLVHRREGEPCPRCGTAIVKLVVAGRGTYICPRCQPAPRRRALPRVAAAA